MPLDVLKLADIYDGVAREHFANARRMQEAANGGWFSLNAAAEKGYNIGVEAGRGYAYTAAANGLRDFATREMAKECGPVLATVGSRTRRVA